MPTKAELQDTVTAQLADIQRLEGEKVDLQEKLDAEVQTNALLLKHQDVLTKRLFDNGLSTDTE